MVALSFGCGGHDARAEVVTFTDEIEQRLALGCMRARQPIFSSPGRNPTNPSNDFRRMPKWRESFAQVTSDNIVVGSVHFFTQVVACFREVSAVLRATLFHCVCPMLPVMERATEDMSNRSARREPRPISEAIAEIMARARPLLALPSPATVGVVETPTGDEK
jgi:hypothetical protein